MADRVFGRKSALLSGIGVALAPWYAFLIANFPLAAVNPFAGINPFFTYRETPEIAPFQPACAAPITQAIYPA